MTAGKNEFWDRTISGCCSRSRCKPRVQAKSGDQVVGFPESRLNEGLKRERRKKSSRQKSQRGSVVVTAGFVHDVVQYPSSWQGGGEALIWMYRADRGRGRDRDRGHDSPGRCVWADCTIWRGAFFVSQTHLILRFSVPGSAEAESGPGQDPGSRWKARRFCWSRRRLGMIFAVVVVLVVVVVVVLVALLVLRAAGAFSLVAADRLLFAAQSHAATNRSQSADPSRRQWIPT